MVMQAREAIGGSFDAYDGENRMISSPLSGNSTTYYYCGEGRRVQKATGLAATTPVYDAQGQLAEEVATQLAQVHGTEYLTGRRPRLDAHDHERLGQSAGPCSGHGVVRPNVRGVWTIPQR